MRCGCVYAVCCVLCALRVQCCVIDWNDGTTLMCQPAFQVHTHMIACLQVVVPSMCKAHHYADIDMAEERALPCGEVACDSVHCLPNARDEIDGMNTVVGGPSVCPARSLWLVDLISDKTTSRRGTSLMGCGWACYSMWRVGWVRDLVVRDHPWDCGEGCGRGGVAWLTRLPPSNSAKGTNTGKQVGHTVPTHWWNMPRRGISGKHWKGQIPRYGETRLMYVRQHATGSDCLDGTCYGSKGSHQAEPAATLARIARRTLSRENPRIGHRGSGGGRSPVQLCNLLLPTAVSRRGTHAPWVGWGGGRVEVEFGARSGASTCKHTSGGGGIGCGGCDAPEL